MPYACLKAILKRHLTVKGRTYPQLIPCAPVLNIIYIISRSATYENERILGISRDIKLVFGVIR